MRESRVKASVLDGSVRPVVFAGVSALFLMLIVTTLALAGGVSYRVATDASGNQGNGQSAAGSISLDGTLVAFESDSNNLVPGDTNGVTDVFLKNTVDGSITRISTNAAGSQALGGPSAAPKITPDGKYVVFHSQATTLVPGDTNGVRDAFIKEIATGAITRVSVSSAGAQGNGVSELPTVSADGTLVAFRSNATNLVAGDSNVVTDVFVHNTTTGTTTRVSTDSAGNQANAASGITYGAWIAAGGNHVVFESDADNLVAGDSNTTRDIFVKDLTGGATTRVSTDSSNGQANGGSYYPTISADGRYVAFRSIASNLAAGDTIMCGAINCSDVFVKDTLTGAVYWSSTDAAGNPAETASWDPAISPDGRFVSYSSSAANIVYGDANGTYDVFVKDITGGGVELVSKNATTGIEGNNWSIGPWFSYGGGYVVFYGAATDLVSGDTNGVAEVFVSTNEMACPAGSPGLALSLSSVYWASFDDYTNRLLSVDYAISNASADPLLATEVTGSLATVGVTLFSATPVAVGDVPAGGSASVTLVYLVPMGVGSFKATVYVDGTDGCGGTHVYPGPFPGV